MGSIVSTHNYHPRIHKNLDNSNTNIIENKDSIFSIAKACFIDMELFRDSFSSANTLMGCARFLPLNEQVKSAMGSSILASKEYLASFCLPWILITQINFLGACNELKNAYCGKGIEYLHLKSLFLSSVGLGLSSVKLAQFFHKVKWVDLAKTSVEFPIILAKTSNVLLLILIGNGVLKNLWAYNAISSEKAADKNSEKANIAIRAVAAKSLDFGAIAATTATLFWGVTLIHPGTLAAIKVTSLFLYLYDGVDAMIEQTSGSEPKFRHKGSLSHLPS